MSKIKSLFNRLPEIIQVSFGISFAAFIQGLIYKALVALWSGISHFAWARQAEQWLFPSKPSDLHIIGLVSMPFLVVVIVGVYSFTRYKPNLD